MSIKEKYSDRRHNQRRHDPKPDALETPLPDKKIRQGDRKCDLRRDNERQNVSFEVLFDSQDDKTINVSASGIYFEVPTTDIEAFSSGTEIPIQINTVTSAPYSRETKLKLTGRGIIIRSCIIENPDHENSLGIAVKFIDKLNIKVDSD